MSESHVQCARPRLPSAHAYRDTDTFGSQCAHELTDFRDFKKKAVCT